MTLCKARPPVHLPGEILRRTRERLKDGESGGSVVVGGFVGWRRESMSASEFAFGVDDPSRDTHLEVAGRDETAQKTAMMSPGEVLWSRTSLAPYQKLGRTWPS